MAKAKNVKQHNKSLEYMDVENEWGDTEFVVEGIHYKTKEEAKKAIQELLDNEFKSRYNKTANVGK